MPKVPAPALTTPWYILIGIILGRLLQRAIHSHIGWTDAYKTLYTSGGYAMTQGDLATIIAGALMFFFGGKIHRALRYIGLGIVLHMVSFEFTEALKW